MMSFSTSAWLRANTISFVSCVLVYLLALGIQLAKAEIRQKLFKFKLEAACVCLVDFFLVDIPLISLANLLAVYWNQLLDLPVLYRDISSVLLTGFLVGIKTIAIF